MEAAASGVVREFVGAVSGTKLHEESRVPIAAGAAEPEIARGHGAFNRAHGELRKDRKRAC